MISTAWRFVPSCASHSRQSRRPSTPTGPALREVLRAALALVAPDRDVEVVRLLGPLAGRRVLLARVHGEPQLADRRAARRVPQLGVARQVADEHDAIDVRHALPPPARPRTPRSAPVHRCAVCRGGGATRPWPGLRCTPPHRHVAHDAVGDLQDARQLVERRRLGVEDRRGGRCPRPCVSISYASLRRPHGSCPSQVPPPFSMSSRTRVDDLVLPLLRQLGIEHEQNLVLVHASRFLLPSVLGGPAGRRRSGTDGAGRSRKRRPV